EEERLDAVTRHLRFDIRLLAGRLLAVTSWALSGDMRDLAIGYFGASTGAAAALIAAAEPGSQVTAVVSRRGPPHLAAADLPKVKAPVLLIVGGFDELVIDLNKQAYKLLACSKRLEIIPGAGHLFEEPGKLETAAQLAADWFEQHLAKSSGAD